MSKEHNFISAVVYLHNDEAQLPAFLAMLQGQLEENFEHYEIVCVNDCSQDGTAAVARSFAKEHDFPLTLVQMSTYHGSELAMNAGLDISIGDFVYEFDTVQMPYEPQLLMTCYRKALEGNDIVWACPEHGNHGPQRMFYRIFNANRKGAYALREDTFRLLSRRGINRVHAITATPAYRKAAYASSGLKLADVTFTPSFAVTQKYKDPYDKAMDSLALYTNAAYKFSLIFALLLTVVTVGVGIYSLCIYLSPYRQVEGWTSMMLAICVGFSGVFLILTLIIKYLSLLVDLVSKKQRYLVEGVEKIQK